MSDLVGRLGSGTRVMGVFAHPDDETLCAGGTMARLSDADAVVRVLAVSDGAQSRDGAFAAAVKVLGATGVILDHPATGVQVSGELVGDIDAAIAEFRPDVIITHSPGLKQSQDHNAVYDAVRRSVARSSAPRVLLTAEPHIPDPDFVPNVFVGIDGFLSEKLAAAALYDEILSRRYLQEPVITARARWWAQHSSDVAAEAAESFRLVFWR